MEEGLEEEEEANSHTGSAHLSPQKGRKFNPKVDVYTFPTSMKSELEKEEDIFTGRPAAGQDSFFGSFFGSSSIASSAKRKSARNMAFGVADGVGGWADSGIDSAAFSHGLCRAMALVAGHQEKRIGPKDLLDTAYRNVVEEEEIEGGGSTACVAVGGEDGVVTVAK